MKKMDIESAYEEMGIIFKNMKQGTFEFELEEGELKYILYKKSYNFKNFVLIEHTRRGKKTVIANVVAKGTAGKIADYLWNHKMHLEFIKLYNNK